MEPISENGSFWASAKPTIPPNVLPPVFVSVNVESRTSREEWTPKSKFVVGAAQAGGGGSVMPLPLHLIVSQGVPVLLIPPARGYRPGYHCTTLILRIAEWSP